MTQVNPFDFSDADHGPDRGPFHLIAELERLEREATPGPWDYYQPSELPRDFRVAREVHPGYAKPGSREYICRFTTSHDRRISGNGGRGLEGPLEADIAVMVGARNALPELLATLATLTAERDALRARVLELEEKLGQGDAFDMEWFGRVRTSSERQHEAGLWGRSLARALSERDSLNSQLATVKAQLAAAKAGEQP